jgi:hypothetical protein
MHGSLIGISWALDNKKWPELVTEDGHIDSGLAQMHMGGTLIEEISSICFETYGPNNRSILLKSNQKHHCAEHVLAIIMLTVVEDSPLAPPL